MSNSAAPQYYVGLMSGTSMDGVDAVLVDFASGIPKLIASHDKPITPSLLEKLHRLADPQCNDINLLGQCDRACGELFAFATIELLHHAGIEASQIIAIGSHGQTVRHMPDAQYPFSMQIGDASTIAVMTNIDTIADFRRKDIALGGQGAPLVPAFHQKLFQSKLENRVILNIGGIANITLLNKDPNKTLGFDTGPGNTLLDFWHQKHHQQPYDDGGQWAATGEVNEALLQHMLNEPFFAKVAPKSTGRELFNAHWLTQKLQQFSQLAPQDVQATLAQLTVQSIAQSILPLAQVNKLYVCGGGVFNNDLLTRLNLLMPLTDVGSTDELGLAPQWVEGIAFSWLAYCFINKLTSNLPRVTGANKAAILGAFYPAN